ncbi:MAG: N-acetylmuramoyl-L-alanine amidase [Flavobacteriales bacterium]|nr:N-acetylmuramoyl-L-alanine amidase [Flavobacteriales bacterium]
MNKIFTVLIVLFSTITFARKLETPVNIHESHFSEAYEKYPTVPKGMLEAVAFTQSRFHHMQPDVETSCIGLPKYFGVMGLVENGKNYFRSNLNLVAQLSQIPVDEIKSSAKQNILAYAKAYSQIQQNLQLTNASIEEQYPVLIELSELPNSTNLHDNFALNSHLYAVYFFLNQAEFQEAYLFPNYQIDFNSIFGNENYRLLSSPKVFIDTDNIKNENGDEFTFKLNPCNNYAPALWVPADASNYSSRSGTAITAVTIHDMEGPYSGAISWFQNPVSNVSAHYNIRSVDGQITQMVCEIDKGWHVGNSNPYTIGIEHEGFVAYIGWYTEAMYQSSADLVKDIVADYSINPLRCYNGPGTSGIVELGACIKIKGHQHFPSQTHSDPGPNWNWRYFYKLLNPNISVNIISSTSSNFYDSGLDTSNYSNDERNHYLFNIPGATSVNLNFNSFNLENNWDYLWIYDGDNWNDPLIGVYTGTTSPGLITSSSPNLFMEFTSDCATTAPGWDASISVNTASPACGIPQNLQTSAQMFDATLSWDLVSGASSYALRYKHTHHANWTTVNVTSNSYLVTGIGANTEFYWQVAAICGTDTSAYNGEFFATIPAVGITTLNSCSGDFRDSGGDNGQYINNQDWTYVIAPGTEVTVDFTMFDVEAGYDFLYVYDGSSIAATQFAGSPFSGTSLPPQLVSSGDGITFRFTSDNRTHGDGWEATWTCSGMIADTIKPTTSASNIPNPAMGNFTADFSDADNVGGSGVKHQFYQVADTDGSEWRANDGNGFFNDDFDATIHTDWIDSSGVWSVTGGYLTQTDQANGNTNLYADCDQNANGKYLYHFKNRISGAGANKRAGLHYMCDDASQPNRGNSYFVWFRQNDAKLQFYKVTNDVFTLEKDVPFSFNANQWYDVKVVYDKNTGTTEVWFDDEYIDSWTDASPLTTGNQISLRSGNCVYDVEDFRVYKNRTVSETITVGSGATNDIRYSGTPAGRINSIVIDSAYNVSVLTTEYVNVDLTTSIDELSENELVVYPNPFSDELTVRFKDVEQRNITLKNISGQIILNETVNELYWSVSLNHLAKGVYFLQVQTVDELKTIQLIKQ